jgi:hypothetical protein
MPKASLCNIDHIISVAPGPTVISPQRNPPSYAERISVYRVVPRPTGGQVFHKGILHQAVTLITRMVARLTNRPETAAWEQPVVIGGGTRFCLGNAEISIKDVAPLRGADHPTECQNVFAISCWATCRART